VYNPAFEALGVKFGLFSMGEHPRRLPRDAYEEDLQEIILADELGWDEAWIGEHHMNGREEVLPSPEMLITKAAAKTRSIRMGPGVRLLALHYPLDVAAEAATADHLTDGRYLFGFGTGGGQEYGFYNIDFAEGHDRVEESIDVILKAWASDAPFSHEGRFWQMKDVYIWPRPLQSPHMPVARACGTMESFYSTGRRGFSVLAGQFSSAEHIAGGWAEYQRGAREASLTASRHGLRVGRVCWVDETDRVARDKIREWQNGALDYIRSIPTGLLLDAFKPSPDADRTAVTFDHMCDIGQYIVGSAETVVRGIRRLYAETGGFGTLLIVAGRDPAPVHERLAMFERFEREVAPALQDLTPAV
jgi:alkanesulfonate monooxygenase SsuD/methylene tetrahydromethanopterin reductase-like flavin-dependent oxidoreductase (luciferase family)